MSAQNGSHFPANDEAPAEDGGAPACPWQESLAAHALGTLAEPETSKLVEHLSGGCPACASEHARIVETLAIMDVCEAQDAAAPPAPSAGLRARLLGKLGSCAAKDFDRPWQKLTAVGGPTTGDLTTVRACKDGYERTGIEGIEVKPLFVDSARRRVSMLVRMAPGTSYPSHRHAASEECFVVSGEIQVGNRILYAGDYQVAPQGSTHGVQSTERGCVLFIVSSQDDELV